MCRRLMPLHTWKAEYNEFRSKLRKNNGHRRNGDPSGIVGVQIMIVKSHDKLISENRSIATINFHKALLSREKPNDFSAVIF